jgi:LPS O-antigen subunit length determinant protein (WzzB/FepE family)
MTGNEQKNESQEIDLIELFRELYSNRKKIYKAIGVGIVAGLIEG